MPATRLTVIPAFDPWLRGLLVVSTLAVCWLWLLPALTTSHELKARLQYLEIQEINGGATFYTEQPSSLRNITRLRQLAADQPGLLWYPSSKAKSTTSASATPSPDIASSVELR